MPKCYQLIGVPAAGKSTWYKNQGWLGEDKKDHKYVSTDQHVEGYAKDQGKTYSEVFEEYSLNSHAIALKYGGAP